MHQTMPKGKKTEKKPKKVVKITYEDSDTELEPDSERSDIEFDAEEEEFFTEQHFDKFSNKVEYFVYDPEKYKNESHREIYIVPKNKRRTSEVITQFELTDVISNRAKHIENGSPVYTPIGDESDPLIMAEMEIKMKKCPLSIRRMLTSNIAEIWEVNEMIVKW